jgi:hypothetical protein
MALFVNIIERCDLVFTLSSSVLEKLISNPAFFDSHTQCKLIYLFISTYLQINKYTYIGTHTNIMYNISVLDSSHTPVDHAHPLGCRHPTGLDELFE